MSEQILEQVSAFLDGELPNAQTDLLLKRLARDAELRESFGRYAFIGECVRGGGRARLSGFAGRVNAAVDGEPALSQPHARAGRRAAWWRPFAGAAVAAGVAAVAVVALQQRAVVPAPLVAAQNVVAAAREPLSYTVPTIVPDAPAALPTARLTNYVFAHSRYSSVLGQNDVLNDLLSAGYPADAAANDAAVPQPLELRAAP